MKNRFAIILALGLLSFVVTPTYMAKAEDRLTVLNSEDEEVFTVNEDGYVFSKKGLLANGSSSVGAAPMVLGQDIGNRGIVITDKAATNPKRIYFGWNTGTTMEYMEIFALQEGVAFKNLILNPNAGYVGIGTTSPSHPLQMASGAYVSSGGVWTNASSREYKTDIKKLSTQKAIDTLKQLDPVEFAYKADSHEKHIGFIAEDAPELVATKDKKGMSSMDVVAVLTKVVQEQQKVVQEQRVTIAELSRRLAVVEKGIKIAKYQD